MFDTNKVYTIQEVIDRIEAAMSMGQFDKSLTVKLGNQISLSVEYINSLRKANYRIIAGEYAKTVASKSVVENNFNSEMGRFSSPVMKSLHRSFFKIATEPKELQKFIESLDRLFGKSIRYYKDEEVFKDKDGEVYQSVKHLGKKFKLNKMQIWSEIAENIKSLTSINVRYFTNYADLLKYYRDDDCSGGSCMRYAFSHLPLHPCVVYAHDAKDVVKDVAGINQDSCVFAISEETKLAVMFEGDKPVARCMVHDVHRGKAQGSRASELIKWLEDEGNINSDDGIMGYINIIALSNGEYIMPYIDGVDTVDTDGELHEGSLSTTNTNGTASEGVWSDWHDEYIDEDHYIYSEAMEDNIRADEAVELFEGGYAHPDWDEIKWSDYSDTYFYDVDDWYFLEFKNDWVHADDVASLCMDYISENANVSELIEFCDKL